MKAETQLEMHLDVNALAKEVLMDTLRKHGLTHVRNDANDMFASLHEMTAKDITSRLSVRADIVLLAMVDMSERLGKANV